MFMFNPNLFFVTFLNQTLIGLTKPGRNFGWARNKKAENTFNDIEIVEEYIQDVVKPVFRQFRSAQIRYFYD